MVWKGRWIPLLTDLCGNDPFGSRPEPGASLIAPILLLPPGEVPEGRARVHPIGHSVHPRRRI
jgi:hypothetical protein